MGDRICRFEAAETEDATLEGGGSCINEQEAWQGAYVREYVDSKWPDEDTDSSEKKGPQRISRSFLEAGGVPRADRQLSK